MNKNCIQNSLFSQLVYKIEINFDGWLVVVVASLVRYMKIVMVFLYSFLVCLYFMHFIIQSLPARSIYLSWLLYTGWFFSIRKNINKFAKVLFIVVLNNMYRVVWGWRLSGSVRKYESNYFKTWAFILADRRFFQTFSYSKLNIKFLYTALERNWLVSIIFRWNTSRYKFRNSKIYTQN